MDSANNGKNIKSHSTLILLSLSALLLLGCATPTPYDKNRDKFLADAVG